VKGGVKENSSTRYAYINKKLHCEYTKPSPSTPPPPPPPPRLSISFSLFLSLKAEEEEEEEEEEKKEKPKKHLPREVCGRASVRSSLRAPSQRNCRRDSSATTATQHSSTFRAGEREMYIRNRSEISQVAK